jgi:Tol biopolymer transport system component
VNPGDLLGHYRIVEPLGKGGMGEVFVAEDTRLNRRVALKILPPLFAADPDYRERFRREAQAIAALNHPGIVTIHSVEEHDRRMMLTMELVDGAPLSEMIPKGGLPLEKLLRIGIEVADAMAAAQQRGITHRDLKPGNIIVTPSGRAKVLDFGLAKVRDDTVSAASEDQTRMATRSDITSEGKIVGTVAYMSPEQAEGKPVDPRSDIFSLGVVLHEMATGGRPFKGDTNVAILSSILKDTPSPVTDANPALPADLARVIRRCLAKDPERRYQTAADVRNELEELKQDTSSGTTTMAAPGRRSLGDGPVVRGRGPVAAVVAGVAAIAVAIMTVMLVKQRAAPAAATGFTIDRLQRLTTTGTAFIAAISPDGRYVVHAKIEEGGASLWTRQTAASSDVRIVAPSDTRIDGLVFAPDGNHVYYSTYSGGIGVAWLHKVPVLGGTPTRVLEDLDSPVTFSPDQKQIAFLRGSAARGTTELLVADVTGANARVLAVAPPPDKFQPEGISWSPDGKTILATAGSTRPGIPALVYAVDTASGAVKAIGEPWGFVRDVQWLRDGRSFLVTGVDLSGVANQQIWRLTYPSGEKSRVTNDLNSYTGVSLSADGRSLATVQAETVARVYVTDGANREPLRVTSGSGRADGRDGLTWTADGRIVYSSTASGLPQLWISDADGANARQLTSMPGPASFPRGAPDGKWIYFSSYAKEGMCLFRIAPDGSGLQQLTTNGDAQNALLSADGKTLYHTSNRSGSPRLMKVSADGGTPEPVTPAYFRAHDISHDGKRLLGLAWNEQLRRVVATIYSLEDGGFEQRPGLPINTWFMPDGTVVGVQRIQGKSEVGSWPAGGTFTPMVPPSPEVIFGGAVSRDGRVAFSRGTHTNDVVLISVKQETK